VKLSEIYGRMIVIFGNKCISERAVYKWNYSMVSKSVLLIKYIFGRPTTVTYVNV
jgi:hypothetical protein